MNAYLWGWCESLMRTLSLKRNFAQKPKALCSPMLTRPAKSLCRRNSGNNQRVWVMQPYTQP